MKDFAEYYKDVIQDDTYTINNLDQLNYNQGADEYRSTPVDKNLTPKANFRQNSDIATYFGDRKSSQMSLNPFEQRKSSGAIAPHENVLGNKTRQYFNPTST